MARQKSVNYSRRCWHFSLPGAGRAAYDFRQTVPMPAGRFHP